MKYPENIETAFEVENIILKNGAIPCTIGILDGKVKVGLTRKEIETLGTISTQSTTENPVIKCSTRDLPYVTSQKLSGSTTVSSSAFISSSVGLDVFCTGGIGGVHRDVIDSFDISNDLVQLAHLPKPLSIVFNFI